MPSPSICLQYEQKPNVVLDFDRPAQGFQYNYIPKPHIPQEQSFAWLSAFKMLTRRAAQIFVLVALFLCHAVIRSQVVIYQDIDCKTEVTIVVASNDYPDELCTEVAEQTTKDFQSFQFLSLDPGCAGMLRIHK